MQEVATAFVDTYFQYTQVCRSGMVALYRQVARHGRGPAHYEVVRLQVAKAHTWPDGTVSPEREVYPSATQWGRLGWTYHTRPEAERQMARLVARQ